MKKLTEEQEKMINNGVRKPDIVVEGKVLLFVLLMVICAILLCGGVFGLVLLVEYIVKSLC